MKALVAAVPNMSERALVVSFRGGALRVLGRASEIDRTELIDEMGSSGVKGKECAALLGACEFLVRQARKVGDPSKLGPRLLPLGFTPESLQCLEDTIVWMEEGATLDATPEPELEDGDVVRAEDAEDDEDEMDEETKAILEQALAAADAESASSDDDDDDDDDEDDDDDDDEEDLEEADIPFRTIKLPIAEGMHAASKLTDEQLHHFLRATLMHMLQKDIPAETLDALDQVAKENEILPEELPSILQHLRNMVLQGGKSAAQAPDPDTHDYQTLRMALTDDSWGPFTAFKQDIMVGASRRWKREVLEQRARAQAARQSNLAAQLTMEGYLLKRGEMNTEFKRRWFELKGNEVRYYKYRGEKKAAGTFHYGGAKISLVSAEIDESSFADVKHVRIELPGRVYVLQGETDGSQQAWFTMLQKGAQQYKMTLEDDEYNDDEADAEAGAFSGYLLKQGEKNKKFKRRWCVLAGVTIKYYKEEGGETPAGVFHIGGAVVETTESLTMNVKLPHRTYVLRATKQADLDAWVKEMGQAQADFLAKGQRQKKPQTAEKTADEGATTAAAAVEEGVPPEGAGAAAAAGAAEAISIHSEVPAALDKGYVLGTMKQFQSL